MSHYKNLSLSDIDGETWKPVIGYDGYYQVSSHGRIKSLGRATLHNYGGKRLIKTRIIGQTLNHSGYLRCTLCVDQKRTYHFVHRLVANSFIGLRTPDKFVNHKDGVKENNYCTNLEWVTASQNSQHAFDNGLIPKMLGAKNPMTILTEKDVVKIKTHLRDKTMPINELARKFNVSRGAIYGIKKGFNWKHICL